MPIAGERAFAADPDVFLVTLGSGAREALLRHPLLSRTRAVREGRVVEMPNRLLVSLSDRAADACWWLAARLHPDRVPRGAAGGRGAVSDARPPARRLRRARGRAPRRCCWPP